jgi:hypothetical protein
MCQHLGRLGCCFTDESCTQAAATGHVHTLHWLRQSECAWDVSEVCLPATRYGHFDIIEYVIQHGEVLSVELLNSCTALCWCAQ